MARCTMVTAEDAAKARFGGGQKLSMTDLQGATLCEGCGESKSDSFPTPLNALVRT